MKKVVLYARVSSERQAEKDLSIASQLKELKKYSDDKGYTIYKEFIDEAESAKTANRPAFKRMIAMVKRKPKFFDIILVWKLSRFARNRKDSIIYKSLLKKHGVQVMSVSEPIDDTAIGRVLEGFIEVMDEFYSVNLGEETTRGMRENASRGFFNGGAPPLGYKIVETQGGVSFKKKMVPHETFAPIVQQVFQMYLNGISAGNIVKTLFNEGVKTKWGTPWAKSQVFYLLNNEIYTGTFIWDTVRIENNHPALIDKETFNNAKTLLTKRRPANMHPRTVGSRYLLSGLLYCGSCKAKMTGHAAKSSNFFYYGCNTHIKKGNNFCDTALVNKEKLENFLIDRLKENVLTENNLTELVKLTNEELPNATASYRSKIDIIERQLENLRNRLHKQYNALETGKLDIEHLAPRIKYLTGEIDKLDEIRINLLEDINNYNPNPIDITDIKEQVADLKTLLQTGSFMEQKSFLNSFIKQVEIKKNQVSIEYTVPLLQEEVEPQDKEVLPFIQNGSPNCTICEPLKLRYIN